MQHRFRLPVVIAIIAGTLSLGLTAASASGAPSVPAPPVPSGQSPATAGPAQQQPLNNFPVSRSESVYVAVTPCRILDTRKAGGKMTNGAVRTFYVGGTTGFLSQGGKSGGCGVPVGATAIAASIGATNTAGNGYLTAWPGNVVRPLASNLNYAKGQTIASGGNITIQKNAAASLKIVAMGAPTDIFMDVTGYYAQQIEGMISTTGAVYSGSDRLVSAQVISPGIYRVTVDSDVRNCTPMVNTYSGYVYGSAFAFQDNVVTVYTWYLNPTTHAPVPTSYYFYLTVTC